MRAVNLIPSEAGGGAGRAGKGAGAYALLGVLGLLLLGALAWTSTHNQVVQRRAQLASLQTQAAKLQRQADATRPYHEFASLAHARVETIRALGETRFDWQRAFGDLARVIPNDVWLTSLLGTVTTGVNVGGGGSGDTGSLRGALPNPAIELSGCTTSNDEVARLISRLRLMTGVVRVSLAGAAKADAGGSAGGGGGGSDCRYGHAGYPQFGIVVFFKPLPAPPAPTQAGGSPGAPAGTAPAGTPAASTTPAPAGSATPAASTTPAPSAGSPAASAAGNGSSANGSTANGSGGR